MDPDEIEIIELELKYCERCGGLWLRVRGLQEIYCAACASAMPNFALVHRSKRTPRLPVNRNLKIDSQGDVSTALFQEVGNA